MINQDTLTTILLTTIVTKVAEGGPSKTLIDIWNIACGHFFNYASKTIKEYWKNFFLDLGEKINSIPKENLQNPKASIVGPAFESSKYYFEEKEIRQMFINLISSSMDSTYNRITQHSFVEIIKQLSPHDAKLFKSLNSLEPFVSFVKIDSQGRRVSINDKVYLNSQFSNYTLNEISLYNLSRLGLIEFVEDSFLDANILYDRYSFIAPVYEETLVPKKVEVCIKKYFKITSFGNSFKQVCLKD